MLDLSHQGRLHQIVHELYIKAGLITRKPLGRRYDLRAPSIRKFFRTQMAALGVDRDYIEYMMGHTVSTYHDIKMKDIDFLRGIYIRFRALNKAKNTHKQNRRAQGNHTRLGIKPRRNPDKGSSNEAAQNCY